MEKNRIQDSKETSDRSPIMSDFDKLGKNFQRLLANIAVNTTIWTKKFKMPGANEAIFRLQKNVDGTLYMDISADAKYFYVFNFDKSGKLTTMKQSRRLQNSNDEVALSKNDKRYIELAKMKQYINENTKIIMQEIKKFSKPNS